jgi:hypothetical protein
MVAKKAPAKKKEEPVAKKAELTAAEIKEAALKHVSDAVHTLHSAAWQAVADSADQVIEDEKRYDLLYGAGRVTEGKDANKNLARKDATREE